MITCNFSLSGIKEVKICYQTSALGSIPYPLFPTQNTSGVLTIGENKTNKTFTIGSVVCSYVDLTGNFQSLTETLVEDEHGRYYVSTLNLNSVADVNLQELLNNKQVLVSVVDNNNNKYLIGYKTSLKLANYTLETGVNSDGADKYSLTYNGRSYTNLKKYTVV